MGLEGWSVLVACVLLALAAAAQAATLLVGMLAGRAGRAPVVVGRLGAAAALVAAAVGMGLARPASGWPGGDLAQSVVVLSLAALLVTLALRLILKTEAAGPIVDVAVLVMAALAAWWIAPGTAGGPQVGGGPQAEWLLLLGGGGAVIVAGCAGLMLAARALLLARLGRGAWPSRADLHHVLYHAGALGMVLLAAGLVVGAWQSWLRLGSLSGGDPREAWAAAALLLIVASLWAWRLGQRSGRWAATLAVAAAILVTAGLMAAIDLRRILIP